MNFFFKELNFNLCCQRLRIINIKVLLKSNKIINYSTNPIVKTNSMTSQQQETTENSSLPKKSEQRMIITEIEEKHTNPNNKNIHSVSNAIINIVIEQILQLTNEKLLNKNLKQKKLSPYSYIFAQSCITQNLDMILSSSKHQQHIEQDQQPQTIQGDSLCLGQVNAYRPQKICQQIAERKDSTLRSDRKLRRSFSMVSRLSRQLSFRGTQQKFKKMPKVYENVQLDQKYLPKVEKSFNDPHIQEMRRQKLRVRGATPTKEQKITPIRQIIKKDEKISYDFTGEVIRIQQSQRKGSIISNKIHAIHNEGQTTRPYDSSNPINTINLEKTTKQNKESNKKLPPKRQPEIQFSNFLSLTPPLQMAEGTKFMYNQAIVERQKKESSIAEMKKSLSQNKISRLEFQRLKQLQDGKSFISSKENPSLPSIIPSTIEQNDKNSSILGKSITVDRLEIKSILKSVSNSRNLNSERSTGRISVENEELIEMLIDDKLSELHTGKNTTLTPLSQTYQIHQNKQKLETLSARDKANLQYVKTGSIGNIQLPKISYRLINNQQLNSKSVTLLQSKSRLKEKRKEKQFYLLKKQFEGKLKV